jgi:hypothetical protein
MESNSKKNKLRKMSLMFLFYDFLYLVPVQANVTLTRTVYPIGSDISIPCDVDGYPIPQVVWYKDEQLLEASERIHITGQYNYECDNILLSLQ